MWNAMHRKKLKKMPKEKNVRLRCLCGKIAGTCGDECVFEALRKVWRLANNKEVCHGRGKLDAKSKRP